MALAAGAVVAAAAGPAAAQEKSPAPAKASNVVLVHGAWADGSSWSEVIPYLQAAGLKVTSVQNPLTSVADDVAVTKRALARQDGPTVLVGHSYGGTVISDAGTDPKVSVLVYVAARAPDAKEDFAALSGRFPTTPVHTGIEKHDGFLYIAEQAFVDHFATGLPKEKAETLFAVQQPIAATLLSEKTKESAWRSKPSYYAVSKSDETTSPDLQRFLAKRMKATTLELDSGHLSLVSHPKEIAHLILVAAGVES
ncbi:alpha/beta hydrolase [Rhizobium sp. NTR19]|uniref:Alpha/beta hydrolase n=1 Tax=Neorhizobium turbinariae TaxID=2937795 RepID=A0ABT0IQ68_9HYPH|nr:alpha/beta hydrolase [Neorhizobium turbinariae]MCK8780032.1 alpha/beta hydrolase [Neorhizobium turbinariae]